MRPVYSLALARRPTSGTDSHKAICHISFPTAILICHIILYSKFEFVGLHSTLQVEDSELADVAAVSAGNNYEIGNMIAAAMSKVGRQGVVTLEEGKSAENNLYVVEGMQFDRGYISPYFVTDSEKMSVEYENCKVRCNLVCQLVY